MQYKSCDKIVSRPESLRDVKIVHTTCKNVSIERKNGEYIKLTSSTNSDDKESMEN